MNLNYDNTALMFAQLSGCGLSRVNNNQPIIENAIFMISNIIDTSAVRDCDMPRCEYAAAVYALYDFVCKEAAREKILVTQVGQADLNDDHKCRIDAAFKLKVSALDSIRDISKKSDFIFMTTEESYE